MSHDPACERTSQRVRLRGDLAYGIASADRVLSMEQALREGARVTRRATYGPSLARFWEGSVEERVDTLVDPVEMLSSSHMRAAARADAARPSFASVDPEAQVQWFSRLPEAEPVTSVEVDVLWDEESDTAPTLVLRRHALE